MQLSLLDAFDFGPDPSFSGARQRELGSGAWLEMVPGWVHRPVDLFRLLLATADWERHQRQMYDRILDVPRLVAGMPGRRLGQWGGEVTVGVTPSTAPTQQIADVVTRLGSLAALLSSRYGRDLSRVSLAYYRDGNDSVAFHGDKLGALRADTVVAIVSVGARRSFLMRPHAAHETTSGKALKFSVGEGDLLVMGGNCQETWEHAVPKVARAGPRIAIMFRERAPTPGGVDNRLR